MPIQEIVRPIPRALPLDTAGVRMRILSPLPIRPSHQPTWIDHLLSPRDPLLHNSGYVLFPLVGIHVPLSILPSWSKTPTGDPATLRHVPARTLHVGSPRPNGGRPFPAPKRHSSSPRFRPSPTIVRSMRPQRPPPDGTENGRDPHHRRMDTIGERAWQRAFHRPKSWRTRWEGKRSKRRPNQAKDSCRKTKRRHC